MNKQIEDIAKDIRIAETEYMVAMLTADIDDAIDGAAPRNERLATALYEKGYRKASDVAREIFEEIEEKYADFLFDGHRNIVVLTEKDWEELRKKYESEGADDGLE